MIRLAILAAVLIAASKVWGAGLAHPIVAYAWASSGGLVWWLGMAAESYRREGLRS